MNNSTTSKFLRKKHWQKLICICALAMTPMVSFAQTTITVGTATSTTDNAPIKASNEFHYSQSIYTAANIASNGGTSMGTISKIRYYYSSGSYTNTTNWTIYLGHTNKVSFSSNTDWIPAAGLTNCFSGTVTFPATGNWLEITLTTPFQWNGVDNIVVAADENETGSGSGVMWRYSNYGSDQRTIFYGSNGTNPDPLSPPSATSRGTWAPNIQFEFTAAPACSGTPAHVSAISNLSIVCAGNNVDLSLSSTPFATGISYAWQYNSGSGWVTYPGSNSPNFNTIINATSDIRAVTTCATSGLSDTSDIVNVATYTAVPVTVDVPESAICSGSSVTITASGANTYSWSPASGLNVTNSNTVIANPTVPTTYTVSGTNSFGCVTSTTAFVSPMSETTVSAISLPAAICSPGTLVAVQAITNPAIIAGGSFWEYRFSDENGAVLQNWSTADSYNFTPSMDSVYSFYVNVRGLGCSDPIDSSVVNVSVGFGANSTVVDYDCHNLGGLVSLSSIFGQPTVQSVYTNPLADINADTTNVTFNSSATITGGRAILTPSATSSNGSVTINEPNFHAGLNNAMTVSFKLTADQPINTWGTGGADGLSYSFGNDVGTAGHQNGTGSKLRLSFDAAGNSPNNTGIYLVYGFTGATTGSSIVPNGATTLAYSANTASWKLKTDVPIILSIDMNGMANLTVDGTPIFNNVQMPSAYMNANTTGWKHVFGATTGGDALRQAISDFSITAPTVQFAITPQSVSPTLWQDSPNFSSLQPGMYDVWISSNGSTACARNLETIEIINANPLVALGNDTTICIGDTLILDAGNTGSSYVWSNSQAVTQTLNVTASGAYVAQVTGANGCTGVGSINIIAMGAPAASSIFVQNNMPNYTFTVLNPQNTSGYAWDFGDGTTLSNGPSTVPHTYTVAGTYNVSAVLSNNCGTDTLVQTVVVSSTASLNQLSMEGLSVYPNPANGEVFITIPEDMEASATIYSITGSEVMKIDTLNTKTAVSVMDWTPGVYFVKIKNDTETGTIKLMIK